MAEEEEEEELGLAQEGAYMCIDSIYDSHTPQACTMCQPLHVSSHLRFFVITLLCDHFKAAI